MEFRFKKLLLLSLQINDGNELIMKASPKRVINLQIYANVFIIEMAINLVL